MNEIVDDFAEPVVAVNKEVKAKFAKKPKGKPIHNGHPQCTSGTDCVGTPEEALVQHVLVEGPGDLYCNACWSSFLERNPDLEGVPVDE